MDSTRSASRWRNGIVIAACVVALGVGAAWLAASQAPRPAIAAHAAAAGDMRARQATLLASLRNLPARSAPVVPSAAPSFAPADALPAQIVRAVQASPDRDSPAAQLALIEAWQACARARQTDAQMEDRAAHRVVMLDHLEDAPSAQASAEHVAKVAWEVERLQQTRADCADIPAADIAAWPQRLEQLAVAGDPAARELYLRSFWNLYGDQWHDQLEDADRARIADLAYDFARDALEAGQCDNMLLNNLWRAPVGASFNYVGWRVLTADVPPHPEWSTTMQERERAFADAQTARLRGALSDDDRASADQLVDELLRRGCGH